MATTTAANTILNSRGIDGVGGVGSVDWKAQIPEQYWELIDRFRPELTAQALSILNNPEDAEDVVQETFYDAIRDPEKLKRADSIGAWLKSLNRCNALNRLRDSKRSSKRIEAVQQSGGDQTFTTGGFTVMELRDSVNDALVVLPPNLRTVVKLRYWEYLSCKDIAARLNIAEGSVKRMLFEANIKLYDKLRAQFEQKAPTRQFVPAQVRQILE